MVLKLYFRTLRAAALSCVELEGGGRETQGEGSGFLSPASTNALLLTVFITSKYDFCLEKSFMFEQHKNMDNLCL